jgi:hypothetical protein
VTFERPPRLVLSYRVTGGAQPEDVADEFPLVTTEPHYGGVRWWVLCLGCGRRVAKLYLPPGARRFRCRCCYRLAYQSQREAASDRWSRRARKLWRRIGADVGESPRYPSKPKWMRERTYWRIWHEANALDDAAIGLAFARAFPNHPLVRRNRR